MVLIDLIAKTKTQLKSGEWVIDKPLIDPFIFRLKDAFKIISGKCIAVYFKEE